MYESMDLELLQSIEFLTVKMQWLGRGVLQVITSLFAGSTAGVGWCTQKGDHGK